MRTRLLTIAVLAVVVAAISAAPAAARRSCGSVPVQGGGVGFRVVVLNGGASCREARSLIRTDGNGGGIHRRGPGGGAASYYEILPGGWRCGSGASGISCTRGKQNARGFYSDEVEGKPYAVHA
jgi:hypothetical protein